MIAFAFHDEKSFGPPVGRYPPAKMIASMVLALMGNATLNTLACVIKHLMASRQNRSSAEGPSSW